MFAPPLLIATPPGTPAALLAAMLGRHPQAAHLPELNLFIAPTLEGLLELADLAGGTPAHGLLRAVAALYCDGQTDAGVAAARRWLERRADWSGAALLAEFAQRLAPRLLVSADSTVGWRPEYLDRLFAGSPDTSVLHLVSHPRPYGRAVAAELEGKLFVAPDFKDYAVTPPAIDPQLPWHRVHSNLEAALDYLPDAQYRRVRVEDWQATPERLLEELCAWLGVEFTPAAAAAMLQPELGPFSGYGPSTAATGADAAFLADPRFVRRLHERESLDGPLEWRDGSRGFAPDVLRLAARYGY